MTSKQNRAQIVKIFKVINSRQVFTSLFDERLINETFLEGYAKEKVLPQNNQVISNESLPFLLLLPE